jgi:hypothetical protein
MTQAELLAAMAATEVEARARLAERGLPALVVEQSLADIGRKVRQLGPLIDDDWLVKVYSGQVLALGRLQFESAAGPDGRGIHIPQTGPLTPDEVDQSLAWADQFFGPGPYCCQSWLFDPRLGELSPDCNIARFTARFTIEPVCPTREGAASLARLLFGRVLGEVPLDPQPGDTSLVRLVRRELAADPVWSEPIGRLA